ncbi:MAG: nucleotidyltransferase domain-containing protein [Acidobacteriota bacterium]
MSRQLNRNYRTAELPDESVIGISLGQRRKQIQAVCQAIVNKFKPEKIVLFGSFAYGKPTLDSDVDLLIVMPFEGSPFRQASELLSHIINTVGILPLDLLVRTTEQISERLQIGDRFIREILERGKVMYEKDHA